MYRAYCAGYAKGTTAVDALTAALEQAQADADRYYRAMCARPPASTRPLEGPSFAELSRLRGEPARADRADEISRMRGAA